MSNLKVHHLKTDPNFFEDILAGRKEFELRVNDRDFQLGDVLILQEYDRANSTYTDRVLIKRVSYVLKDFPGLAPTWIIMGIANFVPPAPNY